MLNRKHFVPAACMALLLFLGSACKKAIDYIEKHPDAYVPPCRITNYRVTGGYGPANFVVTYDAKGNPITMMDSDRVHPMGTDQYFRYDKFNRLSDYMQAYAPATEAVEWHKYYYARADYVIDTAMFYETGDVHGPSPIARNTGEYWIRAYSLDNQGRIIKIWDIPNDPPNIPFLVGTAVYDARGNLPLPGTNVRYDDRVNFYRTSKTWQFVYKNYNRNNLVLVDGSFPLQYNVFGLPTNLQNLQQYVYPFNQENFGSQAFLQYACDMPQGPVVY
ncbi:MAG TPA: hypothetical protein VHI52_02515 [Verrucomicrobiae bacterium]|nr:hypothetical protein [Verrucomicrobiae bacterium]